MIVARKGQFFAVDFVGETGDPLPVDVLQDQLLQCIDMADTITYDGRRTANLGILTSTNRTSWADNRDKLLSAGGAAMDEALKELESGAFLVNLDDTEPETLDEHSEMLLTGGTASAHNRWFDKSMQLVVANNGKAGMLSEHSMMDGTFSPQCSLLDSLAVFNFRSMHSHRTNRSIRIGFLFVSILLVCSLFQVCPLLDLLTTSRRGRQLRLWKGREEQAKQKIHPLVSRLLETFSHTF
jgi:hypothetical protein